MTVPETTDIAANVRTNNNLAWRNVNVVNLQRAPTNQVECLVRNVAPTPKPLTLMFTADQGFLTTGGGATLDLGAAYDRWQTNGGRGMNVTNLGGTVVVFVGSPAKLQDIPFGPNEEQTVQLTITAPVPLPVPGTNHVYNLELIQIVDGQAIGGVGYAVTTRALDTDTDHDES